MIGVTTGVPDKTLFRVGEVRPHSVAAAAGLHEDDTILTINGKAVDSDSTLDTIRSSIGKKLTLAIRNDAGIQRSVVVIPAADKEPGEKVAVGRIGVTPDETALSYKRLSLSDSFASGTRVTGLWFETMYMMIRSGEIKNQVGGTVKMLNTTHKATQRGSFSTLDLVGELSLSLGFFNLLPIPMLDGGHILLMFVELIRRRKLSVEQTNIVSMGGLAALALMFVTFMYKDILGMIHHS